MADLEFELNSHEFDSKMPQYQRVIGELPRTWLLQGGEIYESQMRIEVPISSGRLQSSIYQKIFNDYIEIWTNSGYGKAVDQGRRGFDVYPVNARVLRFFIGSKVVFAKHTHPGPAKGNFFIERTLINGAPRILGMMEMVYKEKIGSIS